MSPLRHSWSATLVHQRDWQQWQVIAVASAAYRLAWQGVNGVLHGQEMCPAFAYARRNGNVYVGQGSWLSLWTPVVLMENNLLTWKWMASLALLAYGTMQLDGCPRGNSGLLPRAIYIWISSHFHFHLETGTEPIVLMKNNIFIMIISTFKKKNVLLTSGLFPILIW